MAEKPLRDRRLCPRVTTIVAVIPLHNKKRRGSGSRRLLAGTDTKDGNDGDKRTAWFEFYSGFGSGSDVAPAKPHGVQSESPSASGSIPFRPSLGFSAPSERWKGICREGWCWRDALACRLLSRPGSVERRGLTPTLASPHRRLYAFAWVFWKSLGCGYLPFS